jgi:hypothetical protein
MVFNLVRKSEKSVKSGSKKMDPERRAAGKIDLL